MLNNISMDSDFSFISSMTNGFNDLTKEEHLEIYKFTLLWSLFEARIMKENANARSIPQKIRNKRVSSNLWFEPHLRYFQNRYITSGTTNPKFQRLQLRPSDNEALIKDVLTGINQVVEDQLITSLMIVYRYRNNLFHGPKWAYDIKDQLNNFKHANSLLKGALVELN